MTEDQYILVYCRRGAVSDKFSLWLHRGTSRYPTINWNGLVTDPTVYHPGYNADFNADVYTECSLTKVQADAAIMVARSATSRKIWERYARRLMEGKVA